MVKTLKCLTCGADLLFNPTLQKFKCEWCDSEYEEKDLGSGVIESPGTTVVDEVLDYLSSDEIKVYRCAYCGAEVVTDNVTSATFCVYCQRPVALGTQLSGEFKPCVMIPFQNTKEEALTAFKNYLKKKRFIPDEYKSNQNIEKLTGVYLPFWLYCGDVGFDVKGEADIVNTKHIGDYKIIETNVYSFEREGSIKINNIPVDASSRTPDDVIDSIEPFNFDKLNDFSANYLSGFLAERYDEDKDQLYARAKKRFEGSAENKVRDSLKKYTKVRRNTDKKRVDNLKSKYGLLPVWLLYSNYKDKRYIFAMNGQTGKLIGDVPVDGGKVFRFGASVFGIAGVLGALAALALQWVMSVI